MNNCGIRLRRIKEFFWVMTSGGFKRENCFCVHVLVLLNKKVKNCGADKKKEHRRHHAYLRPVRAFTGRES